MEFLPLRRATRGWLVAFGMLTMSSTGGCNMLAALGYVAHEDAVPAECNALEGKKIAIVCRAVEQLKYSDVSAAPELANSVAALLKKNMKKKPEIVSSSQVAEWADTNAWSDYTQVGKALKVDMVVGIDIEQFSLNEGQTLYKGRSTVHVCVYDMKNGGKKVFDLPMPETVFPPNSAVANTEKTDEQFRRMFIDVLADHIGRHFYDHDPRVDFCSDTNVLNN